MGEDTYCPECGRFDRNCICNIVVEHLEDSSPDFKWESAFESITELNSTSFRIIMPIYE